MKIKPIFDDAFDVLELANTVIYAVLFVLLVLPLFLIGQILRLFGWKKSNGVKEHGRAEGDE